MCVLYNTDSVDISIEAASALSSVHYVNNCLVDNSILECFINDEASDDRAVKCCISNHYHHYGRRRFVAVEGTEINNQCAYVTGRAKTGHICTNYTCSENSTFLSLCS